MNTQATSWARYASAFLAILLSAVPKSVATATEPLTPADSRHHRLIVLADMGNEEDEEQQMLHLLMYSNVVNIEGLIAVTGKHLRPEDARPYRRIVHPELYLRLIAGYENVFPNLQLHATNWPTPQRLRSIVASGQSGYGIADVGEGKSSEGSKLIVAAATRPDPRPLHIVVNAGANTLAQALVDCRATLSNEQLQATVAKIRVFDNQAQDDAGAWICHEFPNIHWIRSKRQTRAYGGPDDQVTGPHVWKPFPNTSAGQDGWAAEHVRSNHGALGSLYPQRRVFSPKFHFIEGGGTIPWMRLIASGLTDPSEPTWGGWSGRYTAQKQINPFSPYKDIAIAEQAFVPFAAYADATANSEAEFESWTDPNSGQVFQDVCVPVWRWRTAMWNDFQARMDWCVKPLAEANHPPHAELNADASDSILKRTAKPGETLAFTATGSTDPDKDTMRYTWWFYPEAGRQPYGHTLPIQNNNSEAINVTIPSNAAGKELHLILEAWDQSRIVPLVDYRRAVITVP